MSFVVDDATNLPATRGSSHQVGHNSRCEDQYAPQAKKHLEQTMPACGLDVETFATDGEHVEYGLWWWVPESYEVLIPDAVEYPAQNRSCAMSCKPECEQYRYEKALSCMF